MRKEYVRLAMAELQSKIPWIIDDMDNTMQKTYGRMPNMEFIIASDGKLLESRDWADPTKLKAYLEEHIGPSGISDEQWEKLGERDKTMIAIGRNDEVPATEVPTLALHPLDVRSLKTSKAGFPYTLKAATLPPRVTPEGQSRLYLTFIPDSQKSPKLAEPLTLEFSDVKGIQFIKNRLKSGQSRRGDDVNPHSLGVLWTGSGQTDTMEFKINVLLKTGEKGGELRSWSAAFQVSGQIPQIKLSMDEIPPEAFPAVKKMISLNSKAADEKDLPVNLEAFLLPASSQSEKGTLYLVLKIEGGGIHHWNNLAAPPEVNLKAEENITTAKSILYAGQHPGEGDKDDRILAVKYNLSGGSGSFSLQAQPVVWICHDTEGWCRRFAPVFTIKGRTK